MYPPAFELFVLLTGAGVETEVLVVVAVGAPLVAGGAEARRSVSMGVFNQPASAATRLVFVRLVILFPHLCGVKFDLTGKMELSHFLEVEFE